MSREGNGYNFGSDRGAFIDARLGYIKRHGAAFLFNNEAPPAPGYPRWRSKEE